MFSACQTPVIISALKLPRYVQILRLNSDLPGIS